MPTRISNRGTGRKIVRVNVRSVANVAAIRREKRHGRDKIIVPSVTLPDDIVMNEIMYPGDEIEASYETLNGTPAPLGHPTLGGMFCSASTTEAMIRNGIGAYNENAKRANGRVFLDKVIDVEHAKMTEGGKAVLEAIDAGGPIHTSTGLLCELENAAAGSDHKYVARNIVFDHDAILLDEEGAATPEDGVGMLVNKALSSEGDEIEVVNSAIDEAERELEWAADMAARAAERMEAAKDRTPLIDRIKSAIMEAVRGSERETSTNRKEDEMAVSDEQFKALSDEVKTLSDSLNGIGDTITNAITDAIKPVKEHVDKIEANQKAQEDTERADLVGKIVKANLLDEEGDAEGMTINALRKLAAKARPGKATALNGAFQPGDDKPKFQLPKAEG